MKLRKSIVAVGALMALAIVCVVWGVSAAAAMLASGVLVFGMILDERMEIVDDVAIATPIGRALMGDVIDLTKARNIGVGNELHCVIQITQAVTSVGAATVDFELVSDAQAAIAVDGSASKHASTGPIAKDALTVGKTFILPLPPEGSVPYERFLGVISNPAVAALTAGKANVFFTADVKQWKAAADAL